MPSRPVLEAIGAFLVTMLLPWAWLAGFPGGVFAGTSGVRSRPDAALKASLAYNGEKLRHSERLLAQYMVMKSTLPHLPPMKLLGARVIRAPDPSGPHRRLVLDRGLEDGILHGSPVLAGPAVIGRVFESTGNRTIALTLCDPLFQGPAVIGRSGAEALLRGAGPGRLILMPRDPRSDIQVGDAVFTGPRSRIFPAGLYVGEVSEVIAAGGLPRVIVTPAVDPDRISDVMVLLGTE